MKIYSSPGGQGYRVSPEISFRAVSVTGDQFPGRIGNLYLLCVCNFSKKRNWKTPSGSGVHQNQVIFQSELKAWAKVSTVKFSGSYQTYQLQLDSKGFAGYFFKG